MSRDIRSHFSSAKEVVESRGESAAGTKSFIYMGSQLTEFTVYSKDRMLRTRRLLLGIDEFTLSIKRGAYHLLDAEICWWTADKLRRSLGDVTPGNRQRSTEFVSARDRISGHLTEREISSSDVGKWFEPFLAKLRSFLSGAVSGLAPRVVADISRQGVIWDDGGSYQPGMPAFLRHVLGLEISIVRHLRLGVWNANQSGPGRITRDYGSSA